jgi:hypothetical protein
MSDARPLVLGSGGSVEELQNGDLLIAPSPLRGFNGIGLANNTGNPNTAIDFGVGDAEVGGWVASNAAVVTKFLNAAWVQGAGVGGLFSGSVAASTWYHCFVMRNTVTRAVDFGFSVNLNASDRPLGWNARWVMAVRTNASSNILGFVQIGSEVIWNNTSQDVATTATAVAGSLYTLLVPPGVNTLAIFSATYGGTASGDVLYLSSPVIAHEVVTTGGRITLQGNNLARQAAWMRLLTNTSSQIRAAVSAVSGNSLTIATHGFSLVGLPAAGVGVGSGERDHSRGARYFEDFILVVTNAPLGQWLYQGSNGSAISTDAPASRPGVVALDFAANASARAGFLTSTNSILLGGGIHLFEADFRLNLLSNATDAFTAYSGFVDSATGVGTDCAYFRYTHSVNSGNWQAVTRAGGTETAVNTAIAASTVNFDTLRILSDAVGGNIRFFINDALVATITTNLPFGATQQTGCGTNTIRSAGTVAMRAALVDYHLLDITFTNRR